MCPEQLGGLSTPRPPAEQQSGQVRTQAGVDVTEAYQAGAKAALEIALKHGATEAFLKSKSPMCGVDRIYDGTFSGALIAGDGIFTQELKKAGIRVESVE